MNCIKLLGQSLMALLRNSLLKDSQRESMGLEGLHPEAFSRPLPHNELVRLQRRAAEARLPVDLVGQGDDMARSA